jgi:hypothetical protein
MIEVDNCHTGLPMGLPERHDPRLWIGVESRRPSPRATPLAGREDVTIR